MKAAYIMTEKTISSDKIYGGLNVPILFIL